jgi:hypothetical protein
MSKKEHQELNQWIAEHVMGWRDFKTGVYGAGAPEREPTLHGTPPTRKSGTFSIPNYTTDPAAAMEVLKKCAEKTKVSIFNHRAGGWQIESSNGMWFDEIETLELAIALFAKNLFSK